MPSALEFLVGALGGLGGINQALDTIRRQQREDALLQMQSAGDTGQFVPVAPPPQNFLQRLFGGGVPQGMVSTGPGKFYGFRPYPPLGEEGARALGFTAPVSVPTMGAPQPQRLMSGFGSATEAGTRTEERVIPGAAEMRLTPQLSVELMRERARVRQEQLKAQRQEQQDREFLEAFKATRGLATTMAPPPSVGANLPTPGAAPETGAVRDMPRDNTTLTGAVALVQNSYQQGVISDAELEHALGQTPLSKEAIPDVAAYIRRLGRYVPGAPTPPGTPTTPEATGPKAQAQPGTQPATGLTPTVLTRVQQINTEFQSMPLDRPITPQDVAEKLLGARVPPEQALALEIAMIDQRIAQNEQDARSIPYLQHRARTPGQRASIAEQLTIIQQENKRLDDRRKELLAEQAKPKKPGEHAAIKRAEQQATMLTPADVALAKLKEDPKKIFRKDAELGTLTDKEKIQLDEQIKQDAIERKQKEQDVRTTAAQRKEDAKFQAQLAPAKSALTSLKRLTNSIFTENAPPESLPAIATSVGRRAVQAFIMLGKRFTQTQGQGIAVATYEDAAIAHIISLAKPLTGTGRMAYQEVLNLLGGLPKVHGSVMQGFLPDTKQVAQRKIQIIEDMLTARSKVPAWSYATPFDIRWNAETKQLEQVPLSSALGASQQSAPPSLDDALDTLKEAVGGSRPQ